MKSLQAAEEAGSIRVKLTDKRKLAIATLGLYGTIPDCEVSRVSGRAVFELLHPDAARSLPMAGPQKHLNMHGDNLGNVVEFMRRDHPDKF